jgi:hypothetical protein
VEKPHSQTKLTDMTKRHTYNTDLTKKEHLNLNKAYYTKPIRDYMDMDYIPDLYRQSINPELSQQSRDEATEALKFMGKFNREYYGFQFTNTDADLHKTKEERREVWRRGHAVRKDTWAIMGGSQSDVNLTRTYSMTEPSAKIPEVDLQAAERFLGNGYKILQGLED